jgi:phenylacetate-CoA ligase
MRLDERASALLLPLSLRLTGRTLDSMSRELRANESLDPGELDRIQLARLAELLEHCYSNVPYYRDMFDGLGAHPSDIRTLADFAKLPCTDKQTLREHADSMIATNYPSNKLTTVFTGGSTGVPVRIVHDVRFRDWSWSVFLRNLSWTGFRPGERQYWLQRPGPTTHKRRIRLALERKRLEGVVLISETTAAKWTNDIRRYRPRLVCGNPSTLTAIASYVIEHHIQLDSVRELVASSETLFAHQREQITRGFKAPVFNQYGSTETGGISSECRHGNMHVNNDSLLLELVADENSASGSHEAIVTPLYSYGMPLLRFRTGDRAEPTSERCGCGLPFPLMQMPEGRVDDCLRFADGTEVSALALERTIRAIPGIARFQFRQTAPDTLELRVIKGNGFGEATIARLADTQQRFAESSGTGVRILPMIVDEIALTPGGKHRSVVPLEDETPRTAERS